MFELLFGSLWTGITLIIGIVFFVTIKNGGEIIINDEVVENPTFSDLWFLYVFLGIFLLIGLIFLYKGMKKLLANVKTQCIGKETYAIVYDIQETNTYVNDRPVYKALMRAIIDGSFTESFEETIGLDYNKYTIGEFLLVKFHKDDANIICSLHESDVPIDKRELLREHAMLDEKKDENHNTQFQNSPNEEYIIINGKRYKQID